MLLDSTLLFSTNQSLLTNVTITTSTTAIDLLGVGSGNAPNATFGTATVFGADMGVGGGVADLIVTVVVGTPLASTNTATLQAQLQGAVDNGSNSPGTWVTYQSGPVASIAQAGTNTAIFRANLADAFPFGTLPRFLRMQYVLATGTVTTGSIQFAGIHTMRDDYSARYYPSGFKVA
jgi:hypothetical protein